MARDFRHFGYPNTQILGYANSIAIGKSREADKSTWRMAAVAADVVWLQLVNLVPITIWVFPKIGVPPNHEF